MYIHIDRKRDSRQVKEETDKEKKRTDRKNIGRVNSRQQMQDRQIEITLNISITVER